MRTDQRQNESRRRWRFLTAVLFAAKCLWILLLAAALAAGVYFSAPWKVTALLAVLVVTPTIVPKRARKYIYLVVVIIFFSLAVWVFLPEDNGGWEPYVFKDELAALAAKLHVPDEVNAAVIYNELLAGYEWDSGDREMLQCLPEGASEEARYLLELQAVAGAGVDTERTVAALLKATRLERCYFEIPHRVSLLEGQLERFQAIKLWTRLLHASAERAGKSGDAATALDRYAAILKMGDHMYQQAAPLDFLLGLAVESMPLEGINELIMGARLEAAQLVELESMLACGGFDWPSGFARIMDYEKLYTKQSLACMYEMNDKGAIRARMPSIHYGQPQAEPIGRTRLDKLAAVAFWFVWFGPDEISRRVDENFEPCYAMGDLNHGGFAEPGSLSMKFDWSIAGMFKPNEHLYSYWRPLHLRARARRDGASLLAALQRFRLVEGEYPATLGDMRTEGGQIEEASERGWASFVYRREGEGFVLYHTGANGVDDGGIADNSAGMDDVMIWPVKR